MEYICSRLDAQLNGAGIQQESKKSFQHLVVETKIHSNFVVRFETSIR